MKKILSVLCVLAFIASFACISVSADDAAATFELVAAPVEEGATTFTADIVATLPEGGDVTSCAMFVTVPEGLKLTACTQKVVGGSFIGSQTLDTNPYMIIWVNGTASLPAGSTVLATMTFEAEAALEIGTTFDIKLELDPENMPSNVMGDVTYTAEQCPTTGVTVEVVAPIVVTTTDTDATSEEPVSSQDDPAPVSSSEEPAEPSETVTTTEPTPTTGAPATGDSTTMVFAVVAVMVVALGAAVVVKKVNVK